MKKKKIETDEEAKAVEQDEEGHALEELVSAGELEELRAALEEKAQEVERASEAVLRTKAELENYKKRVEREKADHINYGNERLIKELLAVVDNFERAIEHSDGGNAASLKEGVEHILSQMSSVLAGFGLAEVPAVGEKFDPNLHEAISHDESEEFAPGIVMKEFQKGYFLKDRLLRPAMVSVARAK